MDEQIRNSFIERFGEEQAKRIEMAAKSHKDGLGVVEDMSNSPFRWCLSVAVGFACTTRFREVHGITIDPEEFAAWCRYHAELETYMGGDVLGFILGSFERYTTTT